MDLDDIVTREELAQTFGISVLAVDRWRGLRRARIGKETFFLKSDVAQYLRSRIVGKDGDQDD